MCELLVVVAVNDIRNNLLKWRAQNYTDGVVFQLIVIVESKDHKKNLSRARPNEGALCEISSCERFKRQFAEMVRENLYGRCRFQFIVMAELKVIEKLQRGLSGCCLN